MAAKTKLLFFLDQNAPDSLGKVLVNSGHDVQYLRKHLAINANDNVVAATVIESGAILVSADKDFKGMAKAAGVSRKQVNLLHRALIRCRDFEAALRFGSAIDLIEYEWMRLPKGKFLHVEVHGTSIRTFR